MLLRHFSVLRILSRPAAIARSPCVQPRSPSTLWLTFQKESYLIQCLFIKMLMPEVSQQDFSFNKGILFDWSLRSNVEILFSGQQQNPFDNPMQIQVYSTYTHPSAGALPSGLDTKLPLRIPGHPQRLPSLTLSTNNHWDHSSNREVTMSQVLYYIHSLPFSEHPLHVRIM